MYTDPIQNDPNDPLISILVYNYDGKYLRQCLESIFHQDILRNFEVILIDNASNDGSWDTALEFLYRYPRRITVHRNRRVLGQPGNLENCSRHGKGQMLRYSHGRSSFLAGVYKKLCQNLDFRSSRRIQTSISQRQPPCAIAKRAEQTSRQYTLL